MSPRFVPPIRLLEQLENRETPTAVPLDPGFQADLEAALRKFDIAQVSFAIARANDVYTGGATNESFFRQLGLAVPPDPAPNQLFRVASMTKFFTASGIMILQQQGKLSVQDSALERLGFQRGDSISETRPHPPGSGNYWDRIASTFTGYLQNCRRTNTEDQFKLVFDPEALDAVVARMERNEAIANTFMTNEQLRAVALDLMMKEVYDRLREVSTSRRISAMEQVASPVECPDLEDT